MLCNYWLGRALAAVSEQQTLGIVGVSMVGATAHPWMLLSDELRQRYPVTLTKLARTLCDLILEHDAPRLEANVDLDFMSGRRWIEIIGFTALDSTHETMRYVLDGR
jgi:hypothetical protein